MPGSRPEGDQVPLAAGQAAEGDAGPPQGQGEHQGGPGQDRGGAGADQQGRQGDHRHEGELEARSSDAQEDGDPEGDEQHEGAEAQPGDAGLEQGGHQVCARGPPHLRSGQRLQLEIQAEGNCQLRSEADDSQCAACCHQ